MLIPVILSGGAASRLWPISKESSPNSFITALDGHTLLNKTYQRACQLQNVTEVITIMNREYYLRCQLEFEKATHQEKNIPLPRYLLEPLPRNTAPAILLATLCAQHYFGAEAILLVLPADHCIDQNALFIKACERAALMAGNGKMVAIGTRPTAPETCLGYIEMGQTLANRHVFMANQFIEKPSLKKAEAFLAKKNYLWNTGIFCFQAGIMYAEFAKYAPQLLAAAEKCWIESKQEQPRAIQFAESAFLNLEAISLDFCIMEKTDNLAVVQGDFRWRDNAVSQTYKTLQHADKAPKTKPALDYVTPNTVKQSWGHYTILDETDTFKVKRILVKPGAFVLLEVHKYRSEHWIIVAGTARVINDEKEFQLTKNGCIFLPSAKVHKIHNPGKSNLVLIEVQTRDYFRDDELASYEDGNAQINQ